MRHSSPLRYPGGKSAMADLLGEILSLNQLGGHSIAEPFAGGAGAALTLLYLEATPEILINDADPCIHDFWWTLVRRHKPFIDKLRRTRVSMAEWRRQRDIYRAAGRQSRLARGFATFYLNRCNRSGIVKNGGPIGGVDQKGEWKLGARYNKSELRTRCEKVAEYRDRIRVSNEDGLLFLRRTQRSESILYFIDPPYYHKGQTLYLNSMGHKDHQRLAAQLESMVGEPWVLTYDDCPEIREMYRDWARIRPFSLRYVASDRRIAREVLIVPPWMRLPGWQRSKAINW